MIVTGGREDFERWARGEADPVLGVDGYVLGWGGWLTASMTTEEQALALTVIEAEAEHRAAEWDALEVVLAAIGPDGKAVIPDDLAKCERWAAAVTLTCWEGWPERNGRGAADEDEGRP